MPAMTEAERNEVVQQIIALLINECEIACQNVQDRAEYSFTPAKARVFRIGADAVLKEIKLRLRVD